MPGINAYVEK